MTKDEAMKLALVRLQARTDTSDLDAIGALIEALAEQPAQQELMKQVTIVDAPSCLNTHDKAMWVLGWNECVEAAPAQRTWVGLTDEEWQDLSDRYGLIIWGKFKQEIEAKLKEKNT